MDIFTFLAKLGLQAENVTGSPRGFLSSALSLDEWSFVIKMHAFIETLLGYAIEKCIVQQELRDALGRLDLGGGRISKLSIAESLKIIDKVDISFIKELSKIRNQLAHNSKNLNFTFLNYCEQISIQEKEQYFKNLVYYYTRFASTPSRQAKQSHTMSHQKESIYIGIIALSGKIHLKVGLKLRKIKNERDGFAELISQPEKAKDLIKEIGLAGLV